MSEERKFIKASPATRNLAKELGIDLNKVKGSGYEGRIEIEDIGEYIKAGGETKGVEIKGLEIKSSSEEKEDKPVKKELVKSVSKDNENNTSDEDVSFDDFFGKITEELNEYKNDKEEIHKSDDETKKEVADIFETFDFILKEDEEKEKEKEPEKSKPETVNGNSIKTKFGEIIHNSKGSDLGDYIGADEDMIQFMIDHQKDLRDELDGTVIANDNKVEVFTREYDDLDNINKKESHNLQRDELEELKDKIKALYNKKEKMDKYDDKVEVSENGYVQESFPITLNDESIGTVHLNMEEDDFKKLKNNDIISSGAEINDLVVAAHSHNSIAMGIGVKLKQVNEIIKHYNREDNNAIMYIVVKAIAHAMKVNNINNFNDSLRLSKYTDNLSDFYLDDITNMKISEFEGGKKIENKAYLYEVLDLTSLGIDYYFPKESEGQVEIVILGDYDKIKIIINADKDILSFEDTAKVLSSLKEVINNPSLMIV